MGAAASSCCATAIAFWLFFALRGGIANIDASEKGERGEEVGAARVYLLFIRDIRAFEVRLGYPSIAFWYHGFCVTHENYVRMRHHIIRILAVQPSLCLQGQAMPTAITREDSSRVKLRETVPKAGSCLSSAMT